jgi:hypothetical protein
MTCLVQHLGCVRTRSCYGPCTMPSIFPTFIPCLTPCCYLLFWFGQCTHSTWAIKTLGTGVRSVWSKGRARIKIHADVASKQWYVDCAKRPRGRFQSAAVESLGPSVGRSFLVHVWVRVWFCSRRVDRATSPRDLPVCLSGHFSPWTVDQTTISQSQYCSK